MFYTIYLSICCMIILYWKFSMNYAKGMALYIKNNCVGPKYENIADNIKDEFIELIDAIKSRNIGEIILEFCDVMHNVIRYVVINWMPKLVSCSYITWLIVFPFLLPATIKLAIRQKMYGCIRNHTRVNSDHACVVNN